MSNYEVRAKKFIAKVYPYIKNCDDSFDFSLAINRFNLECHRNVQIASGSTRVVMITSDYVIKVDYDGWGKGRWGSCADEVRMYRKAKHDGFAHLFAKVTPVRKGYNRTFYIMPRIGGIAKKPCDADEYVDGDDYDYLYENVGDLHNQNYGWKDGHIVMIDYAYNSTLRHF